MKKTVKLLLIMALAVSLSGCESRTAKEAVSQAKLALAAGDYVKAQNMYQLAADEGSKADGVEETLAVLTAYNAAAQKLYADQPAEAKAILDQLTADYSAMPVKEAMDALKTTVTARMTEIEENNRFLTDLQALFAKGNYTEVQKKTTEMLKWNLTAEQRVSANALLEQSNTKLQEIAAAKKAAEAKKASEAATKSGYLQRAHEIENYAAVAGSSATSQQEINRAAETIFKKWDVLLNDIYQHLKKNMSKTQFAELEKDELAWINEKEAAQAAAGAEFRGGSMEPMARAETGSRYTRERCYYLISLMN